MTALEQPRTSDAPERGDTLGPKLRGWLKHFQARYPITENDKVTLAGIFAELLAAHDRRAALSRPAPDDPLNPRERAMAEVITRQAAIIGRLEERLREAERRSMPGPGTTEDR